MTSENDAKSALEREIYWAEEATTRSRMDTPEVRDLLHDFAALMRADEKQAIPRGEPNLASRSRFRRQAKATQFRFFRPIAGATTGCSPTSASSRRRSRTASSPSRPRCNACRAKLGDDE